MSFAQTGYLPPGATGNPLVVDGVPVTGANAAMPITSGKIAAYASIRDSIAPQLSQQLDQVAAGLITAFAERDPQLPATLPSVEGLFQGFGSVPSLADANAGLAGRLSLNPLADPDHGGSPLMIRDGGFGGAAYVRNTAGQAGFQTRIGELVDGIDASQNFGSFGGLGGSASLKDFSTQSASWVEGRRQDAQLSHDAAATGQSRAASTLAQVTGVNIDQEMATLLDLEKSYQASSKVLSVVNSMLAALFEAVG